LGRVVGSGDIYEFGRRISSRGELERWESTVRGMIWGEKGRLELGANYILGEED